MRSWIADPFIKWHVARVLRWREILPVVAAAALLYAVGRLPLFLWVQWSTMIGFVALFVLLSAVPAAVNELIAMDRDSRLDQLRLSGRSPARLVTSFILAAAPRIAVALAVFSAWRIAAGLTAQVVIAELLLIGGSLSLSLVSLALWRRNGGIDARQAALGVGLPLLLLCAVVLQNQEPLRLRVDDLLQRLAISGTTAALLMAAVQVAAVTTAWRPALRAIAHPAVPRVRRATIGLFTSAALRTTAFTHAFNRVSQPAVITLLGSLTIIAIFKAVSFVGGPPDAWFPTVIALFWPPFSGAGAISLMAREDRRSQRLDAIRVMPISTVRAVASLVTANWLLFAMATIVCGLVVQWAWGTNANALVLSLAVLLTVAPMPLIEGWAGAVPLIYSVPAAASIVALLTQGAAVDEPVARDWVRAGCLCWIPWVCALRTWRDPDGHPLRGNAGVLAVVCLTVVAMWPGAPVNWLGSKPPTGPEFLSVAFALTAGFLIAPASTGPRQWWRLLATIITASALMATIDGRTALYVVLAALAPALAWWIGARIHSWLAMTQYSEAGFSISASIAHRAVVAALLVLVNRLFLVSWPGWPSPPLSPLASIATLTALLALAAIVLEVTYYTRKRVAPLRA